uniref:Uncharacterized protein n=1 Tax=Anguilla anguilla TaxID=7936 RepID=A0A0E9TYB9_ANGAN
MVCMAHGSGRGPLSRILLRAPGRSGLALSMGLCCTLMID